MRKMKASTHALQTEHLKIKRPKSLGEVEYPREVGKILYRTCHVPIYIYA